MRLSLYQRVVLGGVMPTAVLLLLFSGYLVFNQRQLAVKQRNEVVATKAHDRVIALDALLQSAARPVRRTAQLGELSPEMPTATYWKWLGGILADNPALYGIGITFWPANRNHQRKDLYALRGPFGNFHDDKFYYQDESYTYDGTDGTHEWFSLPQKLGHAIWTEPYFDEGSGNVWMISYATPFYRSSDRAFDGVAFADLRLDTLQQQIALTGQFSGHFAVLDADGHFLFHQDPSLAGKPSAGWAKDAALKNLLSSAGPANKAVSVKNWPGLGRAWVTKVEVPSTPWVLLSAVPDISVVAGLGRQDVVTAGLLLGGLAAMVLLALVFARRVTRPLAALTEAVSAAAEGDLHHPVDYQRRDEIGALANSFREMRKAIADRDSSLREANQQLEQTNLQLEQRVEERALAILALEQRLSSITESMPGALFQLIRSPTGQFRYTYISDGVERLLGILPEAAVADARNVFKLVHPKDAPELFKAIKLAGEQASSFEVDCRIVHGRSGKLRWMHSKASFNSAQDGSCCWNGTLTDISVQKRLELDFIIAKRDAEQANLAKGRFLASMSHELRTPLNAVIGLADLTLQTPLNQQQKDWLGKIHRAANTLLQLVNDLLDFNKLESGKMQMETVGFDLGRVLDSVFDMVQHLAEKKALRLELLVASDVPKAVVGDALRLTQVLLNLLSNAIKFTHEGLVSLAVNVDGMAEGNRIKLKFAVRDSGIGIAADAQKRLFQAFTQADASTTRQYGGTGLGLAICQQIVGQLGGQIHVESSPGSGSCFQFVLAFGLPEAETKRLSKDAPTSRRREPIELKTTAATEPIPALEAAACSALKQQLASLDEQLARADGDAVDAWAALVLRMPWLAGTAAGRRAGSALSSYRFPDARSALDQIARALPP